MLIIIMITMNNNDNNNVIRSASRATWPPPHEDTLEKTQSSQGPCPRGIYRHYFFQIFIVSNIYYFRS